MNTGYYDVPMLKKPKWGWEIASYFFLEGLSAASLLLATIGPSSTARLGRRVAFLALLPCPPLLIADLGRPERFHHMLRVFKPQSPMNLGAWALLAYSVPATVAAADRWLPERLVKGISVVGLPSMILMLSYPGVLLETTSTPVWAQSNFLGPLMAASSLSSAAAVLSLARVERVAAVAELAAAIAYVAQAKRAAKPVLPLMAVWGGGVLVAVLLRPKKLKTVLTLGSALLLKFALTYAGHKSALDPEAAREASRRLPEPTGDQH